MALINCKECEKNLAILLMHVLSVVHQLRIQQEQMR